MAFIRQGTCNRCGQCCGADGSPNQTNPWPKNWPQAVHNWEELPNMIQVVGNPLDGDPPDYAILLGGKQYRSIWVNNVGLCKDLPTYGDDSSYSLECPFLADDPGDGSRPCAFTGTPLEEIRNSFVCYPEGPQRFRTQEDLDQWNNDHPLCSYTWEAE